MGGQMPKRLTATEIWGDPWFRKLEPRLKCLWKYLCDNCDHAGVWRKDYELASFQIGVDVCEADIEAFGKRVELLNEAKLHLTGFIEHQYKSSLKHWVKPQMAVITLLEKHGLTEQYANCIATVQDKDKDKDKVIDIDKNKYRDILEEVDVYSEALLEAYQNFDASRKENKHPPLNERSIKMQIKQMVGEGFSNSDMVACVNNSIANSWRGVFTNSLNKPKGKQPIAKQAEVRT